MKFRTATTAIGAVFLLSVLLSVTDIAFKYEYTDVSVHFLGGFVWTMIAGILITQAGKGGQPMWFGLFFTLGFVAAISVGWEWAEYIFVKAVDIEKITVGFTLRDTLGDFINNALGAAVGWYIFVKNIK